MILLAEYNIRQCFFKKIEAKRGIIALKKIKVEGEVKTFVVKMQRGLSKGKLAGIVFFEEEIDALVVRFEKFGTSKIYYKVTKTETGFVANFLKENIAFTHGIFRIDVEKQLVEMMRRFGAEVE